MPPAYAHFKIFVHNHGSRNYGGGTDKQPVKQSLKETWNLVGPCTTMLNS